MQKTSTKNLLNLNQNLKQFQNETKVKLIKISITAAFQYTLEMINEANLDLVYSFRHPFPRILFQTDWWLEIYSCNYHGNSQNVNIT